jgi:hypothetical protein
MTRRRLLLAGAALILGTLGLGAGAAIRGTQLKQAAGSDCTVSCPKAAADCAKPCPEPCVPCPDCPTTGCPKRSS